MFLSQIADQITKMTKQIKFHATAVFLYSMETLENLVSLIFSEVQKEINGMKWVNN